MRRSGKVIPENVIAAARSARGVVDGLKTFSTRASAFPHDS